MYLNLGLQLVQIRNDSSLFISISQVIQLVVFSFNLGMKFFYILALLLWACSEVYAVKRDASFVCPSVFTTPEGGDAMSEPGKKWARRRARRKAKHAAMASTGILHDDNEIGLLRRRARAELGLKVTVLIRTDIRACIIRVMCNMRSIRIIV